MAKVDDSSVEITVGVIAPGHAAIDFMAPRAEKVGIVRQTLEAAPVFRFELRGELWGRSLVIVMSALPLDLLFQADILIAIQSAEEGLPELLDRLGLLPLAADAMTSERFAFAGGGEHSPEPLKILFHDASAAAPLALDGWARAPLDLRTGEGGSAALNPAIARVIEELASSQRSYQRVPTSIHTATHRPEGPDDLSPTGAVPRPGARLAVQAFLHEPFETPSGPSRASCPRRVVARLLRAPPRDLDAALDGASGRLTLEARRIAPASRSRSQR
jgi:hypothetical protein